MILNPPRWIPFVVLEQGFQSRTGAIVITSLTVFMAVFIIIATQETSSRLAWALARDHALLFSGDLAKIHPRLDVPLWGVILVWAMTFLCGFLYLASSTGKQPSEKSG